MRFMVVLGSISFEFYMLHKVLMETIVYLFFRLHFVLPDGIQYAVAFLVILPLCWMVKRMLGALTCRMLR